jgi:hypothetical protein
MECLSKVLLLLRVFGHFDLAAYCAAIPCLFLCLFGHVLLSAVGCCCTEISQVELRKWEQPLEQGSEQQQQQQQQERPPAAVVRACITKLPPGYSHIEVDILDDAIWGLDGYDT